MTQGLDVGAGGCCIRDRCVGCGRSTGLAQGGMFKTRPDATPEALAGG
ncbi:hypothetical protein [Caulobacter segnis]|nr:hypothetical protein [Caulobacter segnis]